MSKRIGTLPVPTLAQRVASLSTGELLLAARSLAQRTDAASGVAHAAVRVSDPINLATASPIKP